jgi:predicted enzyme related to lactoylglutathione lyase
MIYAQNPSRLAEWYECFLGIETSLNPSDQCYYGDVAPGFHFGIYPAQGRQTNCGGVMVNYRVDDFDGFLGHLQGLGVAITDTQDEPYGRFAHFKDCEDNIIEIWAEKPGVTCS